MGDAVSGIDAARHRDGAAHELPLKGSGKALDGRQKVIYIRQRCRNLSTRDFPGLFIGQAVLDAAVSPYDSFTCKGGKVIIAAGNQKLYEKLCNEVLERPDMITDPRFVDMPGRLANQDAIAEVIEERIKDLTPNEAAELVLAHGIPAGPIMNIKEILDDPHVKEREMFVEMDHPTLGKVTVNGCAIKLMDTKPSVRTPAPQLGQNNRDIFEGVLGMTEEQFNTLHEKQVF